MIQDETADLFTSAIAAAAASIETARAKINLALHVRGRRADGYHDIDSLVVFAELSDVLSATKSDEPSVVLGIDGEFADRLADTTPPGDNLVYAVADALLQAFPEHARDGLHIDLVKHLPIAAGVGGGSADAAATLRLLNRIWSLGLSTEQLAGLGANFGADVPVCVLSRPARIEGTGDRLTPLPGIPEIPMVLVNPGIAVPTADVFGRIRNPTRPPLPPLPETGFETITDLVAWLRRTRNDLFEPACGIAPVIERCLRVLASEPECLFARMSGSGATVFGAFPTMDSALEAATRLQASRPEWWVSATCTEASPA